MKPVVLIPEPIADSGLDLLKTACDCLTPWEDPTQSPLGFGQLLRQADAVIIRLLTMDEQIIRGAKRLKVIGRHGVGYDNIDWRAATTAGIPVVYTPMANAISVAEHTLTLMLALARRICPADAAVREGRFGERDRFRGLELAGKTLAVIGLGRVGSRVAQMAALGLGMKVQAYDPFVEKASNGGPAAYEGPAVLKDDLGAAVAGADFLTLHVPHTPETEHMIDGRLLSLVKPGCRIVNTSRGAVIDEAALVGALAEGTIGGAALDVFEEEPLPADHPLCQAPNTLLTPHIASSTGESMARMSLHVAQGVLDVLQGRRPEYVVNPEVFGLYPG